MKEKNLNVNGTEISEPEEEVLLLKKRFMAAGINAGKINWADSSDIEGCAGGLESFYAFGGEI